MISNGEKMKKGFTLIELMVVIFIIGILSAVAIPYMRGRTESSKWTEGRAIAGSIRTAIRALHAELGPDYDYSTVTTLRQLGFADHDLDGRYFKDGDFIFTISSGRPLLYLITVTANPAASPEAPRVPAGMTLDQDGSFTEL
jgi:prepilin-type N-terminal cleavage/methylation domain-containing protein